MGRPELRLIRVGDLLQIRPCDELLSVPRRGLPGPLAPEVRLPDGKTYKVPMGTVVRVMRVSAYRVTVATEDTKYILDVHPGWLAPVSVVDLLGRLDTE